MPIYEYECADCSRRIERLQRLNDPPPEACEACGGPMNRVLSAPAFQFKGTGWYVTDYAGRKSSDDGDSSAADADDKAAPDKAEDKKAKPAAAKADSAKTAD
ncbi:MAG: zinc ribbon domain-containing protein [Acidobacteria bacterium]|nr:zinc ribbon domain-containing protein [Acidobacteriota bacterium]MCZ6726658.1 zinc ribbon domain-containing protein [Acidobacteriota bacterium]